MTKFSPYFRHLRSVVLPFAVGIVCGIIYAVASGAGIPLMTRVVFPVLFRSDKTVSEPYQLWLREHLGDLSQDRLLLLTCLWIPLVFLIRGAAGYINSYLIQYSGLKVLEAIRSDLFTKLQSLPLAFFKKNRSGDLLARLMNDTEILRQLVTQASSDLIKQPVMLLSSLGVLGYLAVKEHSFFIALIALISVPLCVMVIRSVGKRLARRAKALQEKGGDLTATLAESLQSPLEIRAYNLQEQQVSHFRKRVGELLRLSLKVVKYRQAVSPSIEVVAAAGFAAALFFGVRAGMTLEGFTTLGMALYMAYEPVKKLGTIHSLFRQADAAVDRLDFIFREPDTLPDPPKPIELHTPKNEISFENVSFAYDEEVVLRDINLRITIGSVVALVGPSGAGKSTFAGLIPRFYDPVAGRIAIDGTDLRETRKADLRNRIAVVPQMPTLFSGSIMENIRLGKLEANDDAVIEAAKRAHADAFIRAFAEGYHTQVGEGGGQLSGGQRQRIAIARAFLRDAPILILDEATSALDSESEAMVQLALAELVRGRTTFIIAHRFSTISIADRILVFDAGRIVADGSHEELQTSSALYRGMAGSHGLLDS